MRKVFQVVRHAFRSIHVELDKGTNAAMLTLFNNSIPETSVLAEIELS